MKRRPFEGRIVQDPHIMVGKPVVSGTRIPVERVIEHLAYHPDLTDLFSAYPELVIEDVQACLGFARDALATVFVDSQKEASTRSIARP